jgi:uncharacterized protein
MRSDHFEWDDRKAAGNLRKHEISFDLACVVFDDPNGIDDLDETDDEERTTRIGMAEGRPLFVVYTIRGAHSHHFGPEGKAR